MSAEHRAKLEKRRPHFALALSLLVLCACRDGDLPPVQFEHQAKPRAEAASAKAAPPSPAEGLAAAQPDVHANGAETEAEAPLLLRAPPPDLALAGPAAAPVPRAAGDGYAWLGRSMVRDLPIYNSRGKARYEVGGLRLGTPVRLKPGPATPDCKAGWFAIEPRGHVCLNEGLRASLRELPETGAALTASEPNAALPYDYVHVTDRGAFLFGKLPTEVQRAAVRAGDAVQMERLEARQLDGAYFLAVERDPEAHPEGYLRTLEGNFVRRELTEPVRESKLQGAMLDDALALPVAFVVSPDAPVYATRDGKLTRVGRAERYARVPIEPSDLEDDFVRVRGKDQLLERDHVRVAQRRAPPDEVEAGARWLHVDLDSQTLVAYEGDRPHFATLVASGLAPRETLAGGYQIRFKYRSTTMRGEDETGPFEVQEVPWTMFYFKNYALHGAYWHDAFGAPRSHGCTNLAPLDARLLFHFVSPDVPRAWERAADVGTHVVFTRSDGDDA